MLRSSLLLLAAGLLAPACSTTDVNPAAAKPGTGYVDFYAEDDSGLCWEIRQLKANHGKGKLLFDEFKARTNNIVRFAFTPGPYLFRVTFLNRAVTDPALANVVVENGKITPVRVTLVETGGALIETRQERMGASYARTGRSTRVRATEGATFRVEAKAQAPVSFRPKESMPFGNDSEKIGS